MVGAINPNSTQTLDAQIRAAAKADFEVAPGEPVPKEASPTPNSHHSSRLSSAAIVGVVFGGIAFVALCAGLLFYMARRRGTAHKDCITPTPNSIVSPISPDAGGYPLPFSPYSSIPPYPGYFYSSPVSGSEHPQYVSITGGVANETHVNRQAGLTRISHLCLRVRLQSSKRRSIDHEGTHGTAAGRYSVKASAVDMSPIVHGGTACCSSKVQV
jgi:hypothetical protein